MQEVLKLLENHEQWRESCINLIASENVMSSLVKKAYASDLEHRYAEGLPYKRYYQGLKYFDQIEEIVTLKFKEHFKANFVDLRPISGTIANLAAFSAISQRGDKVFTLGIEGGSHISHEKVGAAGVLGLELFHLDFDPLEMNIDLEKAEKKILEIKPKFIIMGGSVILFPQPIKELKEICDKVGTKIIYDAAHVFGLIAAGFFQNPLKEGADIITASTHKTFPGPQGGIILGNIDEQEQKQINRKVFPGVTSNHHLHRIPALFVALEEIKAFGTDYAGQIIKNAKAFGRALYEFGFDVLGANKGFTESHQLVINVENFGGGEKIAKLLEDTNIIVNKNVLPGGKLDVFHPQGIRVGVQEMTRFEMKEEDMRNVALIMKKLIIDKENIEKTKEQVIEFRNNFKKIGYCFDK